MVLGCSRSELAKDRLALEPEDCHKMTAEHPAQVHLELVEDCLELEDYREVPVEILDWDCLVLVDSGLEDLHRTTLEDLEAKLEPVLEPEDFHMTTLGDLELGADQVAVLQFLVDRVAQA